MDISLSYDCDLEVWTFISKTHPEEFTNIPVTRHLIKPLAVRPEPPFPWDYETSPHTILSMLPRHNKMQAGRPSRDGENKSTKRRVSWEEPVSGLGLHIASLQEKLTTAVAELRTARAELHEAKHVAQCLDRKNRQAQTHARQLSRENTSLKEDYKLVQERDSSFKERIALLLEEQSTLAGRSRTCSTERSRMCQTKHCCHLRGVDDNALHLFRNGLKKDGQNRRRSEGIPSDTGITFHGVKVKRSHSHSMREQVSCSKTSTRGIIKRFRNSFRKLTTS